MTVIIDGISLHIEKWMNAKSKARKDTSFATQQG